MLISKKNRREVYKYLFKGAPGAVVLGRGAQGAGRESAARAAQRRTRS